MDVTALAKSARAEGVEGLTILGGEPFDQYLGVARLAQEASGLGLGVICFTGYSHEQLKNDPRYVDLLQAVDLLVDGPYDRQRPETSRALVGSANQRFIHLSSRYQDYNPWTAKNRVEFRIAPDGALSAAGFLTRGQLERLGNGMRPSRHR